MAEEIFLNQMSTGAGSDIENATDLARRMVCEYGMSRLGPLTFGKKEEQIFLGREIAQHRDFSEETARQIDLEVRRLIDEAYQSAYTASRTPIKDAMHRIAAALLERETIDAEEVKMLIEGKELPPMRSVLASPSDGSGGVQQVLKPEGPRGGRFTPKGLLHRHKRLRFKPEKAIPQWMAFLRALHGFSRIFGWQVVIASSVPSRTIRLLFARASSSSYQVRPILEA